MAKRLIQTYVEEDNYNILKKLAVDDKRSMSSLLEIIVEKYLEDLR